MRGQDAKLPSNGMATTGPAASARVRETAARASRLSAAASAASKPDCSNLGSTWPTNQHRESTGIGQRNQGGRPAQTHQRGHSSTARRCPPPRRKCGTRSSSTRMVGPGRWVRAQTTRAKSGAGCCASQSRCLQGRLCRRATRSLRVNGASCAGRAQDVLAQSPLLACRRSTR